MSKKKKNKKAKCCLKFAKKDKYCKKCPVIGDLELLEKLLNKLENKKAKKDKKKKRSKKRKCCLKFEKKGNHCTKCPIVTKQESSKK